MLMSTEMEARKVGVSDLKARGSRDLTMEDLKSKKQGKDLDMGD